MEWNGQKSAAVTKLTLRLAVDGYVLYLMWKILSGTLDGTSTITPWLSYVICAVFLLAVVWFGFYSVREFRQAWSATAEAPENEDTHGALDGWPKSDEDSKD